MIKNINGRASDLDAAHVLQFRDAIHAAGLVPPSDIEADGKLRRFSSNGKKADDAGWYLLHDDGVPAGSFGDWRTGITQTWRADIGRTLTGAFQLSNLGNHGYLLILSGCQQHLLGFEVNFLNIEACLLRMSLKVGLDAFAD
jgi:hypothetical protein